jgi:hypothetical protein
MKIALIVAVAGTILAIPAANADDAHIGVGVGPVGAGVTVGSGDHDRDYSRTKIIKEREEPRDKTVIIKKHREPRDKVIVHEHD